MSEKRGKNAPFDSKRYGADQIKKMAEASAAKTDTLTPAVTEETQPVSTANIPVAAPATPVAPAAEPEVQAPAVTVPNEEPIPAEPEAVPKTPASKPATRAGGRKPKAAPAVGKKKLPDKKSYEKTVTVYMSEEEHMGYKISCIPLRIPLSDFFLQATRAYYRNTFVCADPNCGAEFTIQANSEGETAAPAMCPCCGGKLFSPLKF